MVNGFNVDSRLESNSGVILNAVKNLILLLCTLPIALSTSYADTTFVSGAVSGEWTRDGNPFVVVDEAWVLNDFRLVIEEGVELVFQEGMGLNVFGAISAIGTEENPIVIRMAEGVEHWAGIVFLSEDSTVFNYTSLICPDNALILDFRGNLTLDHVRIEAVRSSISGHGRLYLSNSDLNSRTVFSFHDGPVYAENCRFITGGHGLFGQVAWNLRSCEIDGGLDANPIVFGYSEIDDCRFTSHPDSSIRVDVSYGHINNSLVEGLVSLFSLDREWIECKNCSAYQVRASSGMVFMEDTWVKDQINITSQADSIVLRNIISGDCAIRSAGAVVLIDSCRFVSDETRWFDPISFNLYNGPSDDQGQIIITRSYWEHLAFFEAGRILIDHCTLVGDTLRLGAIDLTILGVDQDCRLTNNVFLSSMEGNVLLSRSSGSPVIEYNIIYGFDHFENRDTTRPFPEQNVYADPLLEFIDGLPMLTEGSPCIDAGDPDSPRDPDGTRSDIGAHYYHQNDEVLLEGAMPSAFWLTAFPNPFNSMLTIRYSTGSQAAPTRVMIYDIGGREVFSAFTDPNSSGKITPPAPPTIVGGDFRTLVWDASASPAGVYFVKVQADGEVATKKVVLMR